MGIELRSRKAKQISKTSKRDGLVGTGRRNDRSKSMDFAGFLGTVGQVWQKMQGCTKRLQVHERIVSRVSRLWRPYPPECP